MYIRDAKNRDEAWLLDAIEQLGLDDVAFRSRDYVIAVDEESGDRAGFGRLRLHRGDEEEENRIELTGIGVLPEWRDRGVGAHVIERLVDTAAADRFETVYVLTDQPEYLTQFGFERVDTDDLPRRSRTGSTRSASSSVATWSACTWPSTTSRCSTGSARRSRPPSRLTPPLTTRPSRPRTSESIPSRPRISTTRVGETTAYHTRALSSSSRAEP